mgnify:CR=1 FL=1
MVSVFTGAELIRNCQVRAPRESKLGKHENAGAFSDLRSIFFKITDFYGVKLAIVAYVSGEIN